MRVSIVPKSRADRNKKGGRDDYVRDSRELGDVDGRRIFHLEMDRI